MQLASPNPGVRCMLVLNGSAQGITDIWQLVFFDEYQLAALLLTEKGLPQG